jgi:hypothetical protein
MARYLSDIINGDSTTLTATGCAVELIKIGKSIVLRKGVIGGSQL